MKTIFKGIILEISFLKSKSFQEMSTRQLKIKNIGSIVDYLPSQRTKLP